MKFHRNLLLLLALAAGVAVAGDLYVPIERRLDARQRHATGIDTLTPAQLEALNAVLRGESETAADGKFVGMDQEAIKSRLKGSVAAWEPGTEFRLENGQTWKVLKGNMKLRQPMEAPEILVVPGIAGRWFLQVHEDFPKARVYRVD